MPRIFISGILIVLIVLIAIFLLWPNYLKFQNIQAQIKNKEIELKYKDEYYKELNSLASELEKYNDELSKINSALPSDPSLISLLRFLQKAAPENGLLLNSIGSVSTKPSTSKPEIKETVIGPLKLSGSYPSLKNFLVALEKNSRIIEVENISFSVPKEGDLFDFGITIKVYSY